MIFFFSLLVVKIATKEILHSQYYCCYFFWDSVIYQEEWYLSFLDWKKGNGDTYYFLAGLGLSRFMEQCWTWILYSMAQAPPASRNEASRTKPAPILGLLTLLWLKRNLSIRGKKKICQKPDSRFELHFLL